MTGPTRTEPDAFVPSLTQRQCEVLELVAKGKTNGEIGLALGISLDGAKWHVSQVMAELACSTREEAARYWTQNRSELQPTRRRSRWLHAGVASAALVGVAGAAIAVSAIWANRDSSPGAEEIVSTAPMAAATAEAVSREERALDVLAATSGQPRATFRLERQEAATWRDSCLGLVYPGSQCTGSPVPGWRLTFRSILNDQPQFIHVTASQVIWFPLVEATLVIAEVNGQSLVLEGAREFPTIVHIVPGTTVVGTIRAGETAYIAAADSVSPDEIGAPAVVIVIVPATTSP